MRYLITLILAGLSYITQSQVIYLTDNINEADYICTIVNNKEEADWLININDWERYSRQHHGNWFLTENKNKATFTIYLKGAYYGGGKKSRKLYFVCSQTEATLNNKY